MKAYTTIEESKQLIEAGLDVNTADMHFIKTIRDTDTVYTPELLYDDPLSEIDYPCWSLAALIELLPDYIEYWDKEGYSYDTFLEISKHSVAYGYFDLYQGMKIQPFEAFDESLVSSVCKTIIWLLENNYIKSNKNE